MTPAQPTTIRDQGVYIVGAGAQTPVGRKYRSAAAAVRCGISAYAEHPFMIDRLGEPMVVARADWLDEAMPVAERVKSLAGDAVGEAVAPVAVGTDPIPLYLAVSADLVAGGLSELEVVEQIYSSAKASGPAKIVADGHAGGVVAIARAVKELRAGKSALALVGGVDSYMDPERLEGIDYADRLHSVNNTWGFTPGEGAGFLLLASGQRVRQQGLTPLAEIAAVGTGQESKLLGTETVCIGEGLTTAFRGALGDGAKIADSYCDLNGETYRANEFGFAVCRTSDFFVNAGSFTAGAECWGDVGSASAPLLATLAVAAWVGEYAQGIESLVWCSSAHAPARGAIRLRSMPEVRA